MTPSLHLLAKKLQHLARMQGYLVYSAQQVVRIGALHDMRQLTGDQHESLAAFRVRFSEFQEQLGKAMRAVAMQEEQDVDSFGSVLSFMERLRVIDSSEHWKLIRELRNAVNHEYEENAVRLSAFFEQLQLEVPVLQGYFAALVQWCRKAYGLDVGPGG
jgi:hypothetical protein